MEEKYQPQLHEYYIDLVRNFPYVPLEDNRVTGFVEAQLRGESPAIPETQPHNNFYLIFEGLRTDTRMQGDKVKGLLKRAQSYGEVWEEFLSSQGNLIGEIHTSLADMQSYRDFLIYYEHLYSIGKIDLVRSLKDEMSWHPFGLDAITLYYWDRLNPLLDQASNYFESQGVDPHPLYK